jgi:hypothetical protein
MHQIRPEPQEAKRLGYGTTSQSPDRSWHPTQTDHEGNLHSTGTQVPCTTPPDPSGHIPSWARARGSRRLGRTRPTALLHHNKLAPSTGSSPRSATWHGRPPHSPTVTRMQDHRDRARTGPHHLATPQPKSNLPIRDKGPHHQPVQNLAMTRPHAPDQMQLATISELGLAH